MSKRIKKRYILFIIILLAVISFLFILNRKNVKEVFKRNYPQIKFLNIKKTDMAGIYEVIGKRGIIYFHLPSKNIIDGKIYHKYKDITKDITQEHWQKIMSERAKDIPLDKAFIVGKGKDKVIIFTDPDCPYCKKVYNFLKERDDITKYIFFFPLTRLHPEAEKKAAYILCHKDNKKIYEEILSNPPQNQKINYACKQGQALLKEHLKIAQNIGIRSTPSLFIKGEFVEGANMEKIKSLIGRETKGE